MWRVEAESSAAGSGGETTAGPELLPRPARPTEGGGGGAPVTGGVDVSATALGDSKRVITIEEQREVAKELIKYFKEQALLKSSRTESLLGWTRANEISNGRWVMFGILVGLLTEYATGVNFVDQIKITISNLGIADIYE